MYASIKSVDLSDRDWTDIDFDALQQLFQSDRFPDIPERHLRPTGLACDWQQTGIAADERRFTRYLRADGEWEYRMGFAWKYACFRLIGPFWVPVPTLAIIGFPVNMDDEKIVIEEARAVRIAFQAC